MTRIVNYLEEDLNLPVNKEKSRVALIKDVTFLGFKILRGKIRISDKAKVKFKKRIRELTRRNNPLSMYQVIQELNEYLKGWFSYFKIQEFLHTFSLLDGWVRSRLRSMQLKKWKNPRKFQRMMIKAGYKTQEAQRVWMQMNKWQSVDRKETRFVMNLTWFRNQGLYFLHVKKQKTLELPFGC
jgi:hypothetical protein